MFQPLIIYLPTWLNHGFNSSQKKHYRILIRLGVFNFDSALLFQLPSCILWQNNVSNEMNFDRNSLTSWLITRKGSQWFLNISLLETLMEIWILNEKSTLHKKWSFPFRISSVNVTKYTVFCKFGDIYCRNHSWKTSFFVQWQWLYICQFKYIFWKPRTISTHQ